MEITGFVSAMLIGAVIGALGRLVVPGRQNIRLWVTIVVGILAAQLGTLLADALGVARTPGVDWIELFLQLAVAAVGVAATARLGAHRMASRGHSSLAHSHRDDGDTPQL